MPVNAVTLLLVSLGAATAEPSVEVACKEYAFSQTAEHKDLEAFTNFLHPETRFISSQKLRGSEAVRETWGDAFFQFDSPRIAWRPQDVELAADGTLALSRGPFRIQRTSADGEISESWGLFQSIWQHTKESGWRVLFDAGFPEAIEPSEAHRTLFAPDAFDHCP